jgi:hypothetical protein
MSGGTISGNTGTYYGGGVLILRWNEMGGATTFTKTGGTIYGVDAGVNSNHALNGKGHAVSELLYSGDGEPSLTNLNIVHYRDTTAGPGDIIIIKAGDPGDGMGLLGP